MIRTVRYRAEIIFGIGSLLHVDPRDLSLETARIWAQRVNFWVRSGWDYWQWKELQVTEERAFRQVWHEEIDYAAGEELYFPGTASYYTVLAEADPGQSPSTHPAKFAPLLLRERYVAFDQENKQAIGKVIRINSTNPRTNRFARGYSFAPSGKGIDVTGLAGNTVWVTYQVRQPEFTGEQLDLATTYNKEDLVYDPATGECFRALQDGTGQQITDAVAWYKQEFPYLLAPYVQYGVASDLAEDLATKSIYAATAEDRIVREINNEEEQGTRNTYALGARCQAWTTLGPLPAIVEIEEVAA